MGGISLGTVIALIKKLGGKGQKGDPGKTPIKGVDYFTEQDIDEVVEKVLEAIPIDTSLEKRIGE